MNKGLLTEEDRESEIASLMSSDMFKGVKKEELERIVNGVIDEAEKRKASEDAKDLLENAEFDLDGALDTYDPTFPRYTPSRDAIEFFILMRLVQGSDFEFDTPIAHYFMVDMLLGHITDPMMFPYSEEICRQITIDINALGFMASRGLAKSTVGISFFAVYSAIKGELPNGIGKVWFYLLIAASSKGGARVNALAVKAMCEESQYLNDYFEDMRFTETESEFVRKDPTGKVQKKDRSFLVRYQGLNTGIRGNRYGERRPCCHIKGTKVTTEYGTYPVEEHPGYKSEGHWETCADISLRGLPNNEIVSKDHSYWAKLCVGSKCVLEDGSKLPRYSEHEAKWTQAQNLTDRHWIGEKIDYTIENIHPIKFTVRDGVSGRNEKGQLQGPAYKTELKVYEPMLNSDWWWLYGLWLGDGSLGSSSSDIKDRSNRSTVVWYIADSQKDTVGKKLIKLLSKFNIHYKESKSKTQSGCYTISIYDTALADWLRTQKQGNSRKTMPDWVLRIDFEKQKQLLLGYIAADGYVDTRKRSSQIRINSVNYNVLRQLQKIANRLGLPTYIRNTKKAGVQLFSSTGREHKISHQWELRLKENCAEVLGIDGIENSSKVKYKQVHIKEGILWRQVKQVRFTEEKYELVPIQCDNKELEKVCGTVHAYETEFGISKNCLLFDDTILNTAAAYSKVMMDNLHTVLHSDAVNALKGGGKGRVLLFFTPFHYGDVNTRAILTGAFTPVVIPMARHFEADGEIKVTDIESSWEAMHPRKSILSLITRAKKAKELKLFLQERMLRLTSGSERLIPDECIQFCDMSTIIKNLDAYNLYITTDFTTTSGEGSDYSGSATWAVNSNEEYFMLNLNLRKMGMQTQYDLVLHEADKYKRKGKNVEIGVEIDGNQSAHVFALEKMMRENGSFHAFAKQKGKLDSPQKGILSRSTGVAKHERFRIASQAFLQKKIWLPEHLKNTPDMKEFISQIKGATHEAFTRSDDGPDLVTMLIVSMHVYYPSYEANLTKMTTPDGLHYYEARSSDNISAYDSY